MSPVAGSTVTRRMALKHATFTGGAGQRRRAHEPDVLDPDRRLAGDMLMFHTAMRSLPVSATYAYVPPGLNATLYGELISPLP